MIMPVFLIGQENKKVEQDSLSIKIKVLKKSLNEIEDDIVLIQNSIKGMSNKLETTSSTIKDVKSENELFKSALETDDVIFGGISTYFTIIAILLSIIMVFVPIVNYFLVLKPNEEVLEKIDILEKSILDKIGEDFFEYFESARSKLAKKYITLLQDNSRIDEVYDFFLKNTDVALDVGDTDCFIDFLNRDEDIEQGYEWIFHDILTKIKSERIEKYYKSIIENEDKDRQRYAIQYLIEHDFRENINYVRKMIVSNTYSHDLVISFFEQIEDHFLGSNVEYKSDDKRKMGVEYVKLLFDDKTIIDALGEGYQNRLNPGTIDYNSFLQDTLYCKKAKLEL